MLRAVLGGYAAEIPILLEPRQSPRSWQERKTGLRLLQGFFGLLFRFSLRNHIEHRAGSPQTILVFF